MNPSKNSKSPAAFTLLELCVVLTVIIALTLVLLPAVAGTRTNSKATQCLNNMRRLTATWSLYAADNSDLLPVKWVANNMDWTPSNPDNTNTAKLTDPTQSLIARYIQAADLFKCPADNYQLWAANGPRVMSVSVNAVLGNGIPIGNVANQIPGRTYTAKVAKFAELNKPGPADTITLLDEHPDSIDDSLFISRVGLSTGSAYWVNFPGMQHNGAATISFADGHAILKRWLDARTMPPVTYTTKNSINVPGSPDYVWVNDRMPYR
jgi:prepilin-type processing-associated H-X9-DG protein